MVLLPKLYPITDTRISGLSHAEQVRRLSEGGATLVQLREKNFSPREFFEHARDAMVIAHRHGVRIIINDRVDIAQALNAQGVHLGQDDLPPRAARELLGGDAIIGFSTHNLRQAVGAARMPIDYLAVGPIFATTTKHNPDPPIGLDGLRQVRIVVGEMPVVAIGGITDENIAEVFAAGADTVAVISAILSDSANISMRTTKLISRLRVKLL